VTGRLTRWVTPLSLLASRQLTDWPPAPQQVVISNILKGEHSSFVREDELIAGWKIFSPVLKWIESEDGPEPEKYAYGSAGPKGIEEFEKRFGIQRGPEKDEKAGEEGRA
jgi:glucose-6-phosphate 1-dehydrogenase